MKGINAYLNFDGNCGEAMRFYQECLGGQLDVQTFGDAPQVESAPGHSDRVMHARLAIGDIVIMASDSLAGAPYQTGNDVWLNINCESDDEVNRLHAALSAGGHSMMAPQDTFWGARFGMASDRYGKNWMFNHERQDRG